MSAAPSLQSKLFKDYCFKYAIAFFSLILLIPLFFILFYLFSKGFSAFSWDFFTQNPKPVGELGGGVYNAIVGSLMIVGFASVIAFPFGIFVGVFLAENKKSKLAECIRLSIDIMQGVPSIVMGIIAYAWVVVTLGSFSALSGGVALALMMLPIIAKTTEETISLIPSSLKEASYALGTPYYKTILLVILPSAKSGIISGILLAVARITGETAPLLFTAFGNPFMNTNVFKAVNTLPLLIFNYATSPYDDWQQIAWGASLLLILFILALSLLAKVVTRS